MIRQTDTPTPAIYTILSHALRGAPAAAVGAGRGTEVGVITKDEMFDLMLEACPSFRPAWETFVDEWRGEADQPTYLAIADLARHLVAQLANGDTEGFASVFAVAERWIVEGDEYVKTAGIVGLLEDLQNGNLHASTTAAEIVPYLLPESLRYWGKVERFWSHREIITDD